MDPSWCPGCDRLILPKRYVVPVDPTPPPPPNTDVSDPENDPNHPPPPPAPTPVPSSPEVRKKPLPTTRNPAVRTRAHALGGGLVHGTGRVRPGGGLKPRPAAPEPRRHTLTPPKLAPQHKTAPHSTDVLTGNPTAPHVVVPFCAPLTSAVAAGKKTRVVISQDPTPLYCSDECRARDLKNSFIDSEAGGFGGAPVAMHRVAQLELVQQAVEHTMRNRRASAASDTPATQSSLLNESSSLPILTPAHWRDEAASLPPVPPNSFVEPAHTYRRTASISSASSSSTASSRLRPSDSKTSTIRASTSRTKPRPQLPLRTGSFSAWGSPSKAALAPPTQTLFTASSSSSLDSSVSSFSGGSALFDEEAVKLDERRDGEDTCATTPSRRGSGSSGASKKGKRVSFASDAKPPCPATIITQPTQPASPISERSDWRTTRPRNNPLLATHPLRDAVSVSPKDRVTLKTSSLPPATHSPAPPHPSQSSPTLARVVDTPSPNRTPRASAYGVAMWPEDEKRTTESARVHGELLKGYAARFGPREGRSLVWGPLWDARASLPAAVSRAPESRREFWQAFEEREAEARARRKAEKAVQRAEEEKVICELLGGAGMQEEDQPQARRMKQMAYDGMPGPSELRGLTYRFDRFLYPLLQPKPTIVEKTVRRWDEARQQWVEEVTREEVYEEKKKLFKFVED